MFVSLNAEKPIYISQEQPWYLKMCSSDSLVFKPSTQEGVTVNENPVPSTHVTVLSPVRVYPGLHFRETSSPGGRGNCVSVCISFQLEGKLSHATTNIVHNISVSILLKKSMQL